MVIGWPPSEYGNGEFAERSVWSRIEKTQRHPRLPCLLVPQPAHAALSGDLAGGLLPESFGELPLEVRQAISIHDAGWAMSDAAQIQHLRSQPKTKPIFPVSFIAASPEETTKAWMGSIDYAASLSPLAGWIVSRHFTFLAGSAEKTHKKFLAAEEIRRGSLQAKLSNHVEDLEKWAAALGFCDLLSLYLLTGLQEPASFPLAHPSSPQAANARHAALEFEDDFLRFTPRIFPAGFQVRLDSLKHPIMEQGARSETLLWEFV